MLSGNNAPATAARQPADQTRRLHGLIMQRPHRAAVGPERAENCVCQRSVTDIPDPSLPRFCTFPGCVVLGQLVTACRRGYGLGCFFRRGVGGLDGIFAGPEGIDLSE